MCVVRRMFGAQVCSVIRWPFWCGLVGLLVVLMVPLFFVVLGDAGTLLLSPCNTHTCHIYHIYAMPQHETSPGKTSAMTPLPNGNMSAHCVATASSRLLEDGLHFSKSGLSGGYSALQRYCGACRGNPMTEL